MTREQEIEHVLDRWFTEGPTRMPDRLFDAVVDRIERVPQRRLARLRARLASAQINLRYAAAAVIVVIAAGLGAAVLAGAPGLGIGSSPTPATPSAVPSASAGSESTPDALLGKWVPLGPPTLPSTFSASSITISQRLVTMKVDSQGFDSFSSFTQPDRLELAFRSPMDYLGCQAGDQGAYTFRLSSRGVLSLTSLSDACSARAGILSGSWTRIDTSALAPGKQVGSMFRPFGQGTTGQVSYTVPVGWTDHWETSDLLRIQHDQTLIQMHLNAVPYSPDAACAETGAGVEHTPAALAAWLGSLPGLVASRPTPVAIGGLSGVMIDLSVAPSWTSPCSTGDWINTFAGPDGPNPLGVAYGGRARYVLLDQGDGGSLLIVVETSDATTWDALVAETMPIVESFRFTP